MRDFQNVSAQQWLDRASRTLPRVLTVILVVAIAWQLVQLTWLLLDHQPEVAVDLPPPPAAALTAPRKSVNVQSIVDAHLFGTPQAAPTQDASTAPTTQMNLVLAGTWASEDPAKGFAFIGESANAARMYGVGKSVRQGTVLHAVYADRVILDTSGKLEALLLPRLSSGTLAAQFSRPAPKPQTNQFTENLRRMAETNPSAFAEIVRPQPVFANGVQRGYRVYPGRNRQQFAKLGLQPGDLVLAINGTPLDDPQRGMEVFNTMGASDRVTITVERNGQPQELSLNTAQMTVPDGSNDRPRNTGTPATRE